MVERERQTETETGRETERRRESGKSFLAMWLNDDFGEDEDDDIQERLILHFFRYMILSGFFVEWSINLPVLFNVKTIILEGI